MPKFYPNNYYGKFRIVPNENLKFHIEKKFNFLFIPYWSPIYKYPTEFDTIREAEKEIENYIEHERKVKTHLSKEKVYYP